MLIIIEKLMQTFLTANIKIQKVGEEVLIKIYMILPASDLER
jgi:hypothetical protein